MRISVAGSGKTWLGFVLGALSVVAGPMIVASALDGIDPPSTRKGARQIKAVADVLAIDHALHSFRAEHGTYPSIDDGLAALIPKQLDRLPLDPWGYEYNYSLTNGVPRVASYGADGELGGLGAAADIVPESIDAIRGARERTIPTPVRLALFVVGALIVPLVAFRVQGRPPWAVGALSGAAFSVGSLLLVVGVGASAWGALLLGVLVICIGVGVLLRMPYSDPLAVTSAVLLGAALWLWSSMIAR